MVDYAFAPGGDGQSEKLRLMFASRANTTLVHERGVRTMSEFLAHLAAAPNLQLPAGNLVAGSHASEEGWLLLPLDNQSGNKIDFETLEQVAARNSIRVGADILDRAGNPAVLFKGCGIGNVPQFMDLLKAAFGGNLTVTAPKFFHGLYSVPREGVYEFMGYRFVIASPTELNRAEIVARFQGGNFKFLDQTPIPAEFWNRFIPRKFAIGDNERYQLIRLSAPVGGRTEIDDLATQFRHKIRPYSFEETYRGGPPPATRAAQEQALRDVINNDATFEPGHVFPVPRRLGYADRAEFIAGHTWKFKVDGQRLLSTGTRHVYTCVFPVVHPPTEQVAALRGTLFFNFYPAAGSNLNAVINLVEDDTRFFAI